MKIALSISIDNNSETLMTDIVADGKSESYSVLDALVASQYENTYGLQPNMVIIKSLILSKKNIEYIFHIDKITSIGEEDIPNNLTDILEAINYQLQTSAGGSNAEPLPIYFVGDDPVGSGLTPEDPIYLSRNVVPEAPVLVEDDDADTIALAPGGLDDTEILVSEDDDAYAAWSTFANIDNEIEVGDVNRDAGYFKFKYKSAPGRDESPVTESSEFNAVGVIPAENIYPMVMTSAVYGESNTCLASGIGQVAEDMFILEGFTTPFTVSLEIKTSATGLIIPLSQDGAFWIAVDGDGKITCFTLGTTITSTQVVNNGAWRHIELDVASNTNSKLYVDGALGATRVSGSAPNVSSHKFQVGQMGGSFQYNDKVRNVAFYKKELHSANFTPAAVNINYPDLIGYWPLAGNGYNHAHTI